MLRPEALWPGISPTPPTSEPLVSLVFGAGMETTQLIGLAVVFAGIGGLVGQLMWNVSYALNLPLNRIAQKYAAEGATKKMYIPNVVLGQLIGFLCRAIPGPYSF